ncbi:unnamed protein product [Adineta steineri]|uniref:G-protein coupled receptors family 1 profile domain-containing protein n=1 Tax=Adineta steineri TaxID=433720 RepID=A0A813YSS4_9BILA|nr:unnamed protein product [Adineta steineri]CAF0888900.1 unnamed protein product [Adineta steineri]CAF0954152.1 unnamed protein product [Adineta steineri]CAF3884670.1 unnamed protein product [Adineta steineri]CAF3908843.1 unnamed protein product [Adineta steineri]
MNCTEIYQQKNYSMLMLNLALSDDSGSWWWWTNVLGTLIFGLIGLIGNIICFFVVCRFTLSTHSFVEYLRALSFFEFLTLLYEVVQALNDLSIYLFSKSLLNFRYSLVCKFYDYFKYSIILLSCWTIVGLTIDRCVLVCNPWSKKYPKLSRRLCNSKCAKRIILILILMSLIVNIPHLIYKEWHCRAPGFQNSAAYNQRHDSNNTKSSSSKQICSCRIAPDISQLTRKIYLFWHNYIFHLLCYTILPAVMLIASNAAILKRIHTPRPIVSNQNEHIRSKLTGTLTLLSLLFLSLYFPYAIVEALSYIAIRYEKYACNLHFILKLRILKRLTELLNIAALGINFFLYILGVNHYRSSTIRMLGLHHYEMFSRYLTIEQRNLKILAGSQQIQNTLQIDSSKIKLLKVTSSNDQYSTSSVYNNRLL